MRPAGGESGDPRRFRMKDRRADAEQRRPGDKRQVIRREGQGDEAKQGRAHAEGQRIGLRPAIGIETDQRLQQRSRDLIGQRQQPDLAEGEVEAALEDWIDRRQQRLHHVVEQVTEADRSKNRKCGRAALGLGDDGLTHESASLPADASARPFAVESQDPGGYGGSAAPATAIRPPSYELGPWSETPALTLSITCRVPSSPSAMTIRAATSSCRTVIAAANCFMARPAR